MMEQENQDKWVCIHKDWHHFTYGKVYVGNKIGKLLDVTNDIGENSMPALYGVKTESNLYGKTGMYDPPLVKTKIIYFIPLSEWRQRRLKEIGI